MFKSTAGKKNVILEFVSNRESYMSAVDELKIEKVVDNLISNAIKYSHTNGRVELTLNCNEYYWSLEVRDYGLGISDNAQKKLFKEFYRGDNKVNSRMVGSGIGLLLVKNYVLMHEGKVSLESKENEGSLFKINIPYKEVVEVAPAEHEEPGNITSADGPSDQSECKREDDKSEKKKSILIVDDNKDLLRLLCEQLSGAGYRHIQTAANCAAAKKLFAAEIPELMILDINLPDGDGFSLFRALHAKADVPALFLSARDADADRLFGLGLGADDYLTKPFLMQELLLRVQHILLRTYRAELARTKSKDLKLADRSVDLNDALVTLSNGDTIPLTATELALLRKLADNRGHIVTYDSLCSAVWGADYYGYENSLGVHIRHLRQKLEQDPNQPRCLLTVRGIGYKLAKEELL